MFFLLDLSGILHVFGKIHHNYGGRPDGITGNAQRHRNVAFFVCHFSTVSAKGIGSKDRCLLYCLLAAMERR